MQFFLFCFGVACIGVYQAFAGYYRYTAADMFPPTQRGKAISTVLSGGVIAAVIGPFLATAVKDTTSVEFAGSYALVAVLALLSCTILTLLGIDRPAPATADAAVKGDLVPRTLTQIARRPVFVCGVIGSCTGYFVMSSLMTAAPIAAEHLGHSMEDGEHVIQFHMAGMYATAFMSGPLTRRIGAAWTMLLGALVSALGVVCAMLDLSVTHFMIALGLVGVGWNLMFVAGSALVANSYLPHERSVVQGVGEIFTLGGSAIGALAAGPLLTTLAWAPMNGVMLVPLAISVCAASGYLFTSRSHAV